MAKFRMIHTEFWDDPRVVEEMTPEDKFFFLYLLSNSNTTQIGIYQITKKQMAFDMGYSLESVNSLLQRFTSHHKLVRYNEKTREIAIKNWGKYNLTKGGKPVLDCIKSELKNVKDFSLLPYISEQIEKQEIKFIYDTYYESYLESYNSSSNDTSKNEKTSNAKGSYDTSTIRGQKEEEQQEEQQEKQEQEEKEKQEQQQVSSLVGFSSDFAKLVDFTNNNIQPVAQAVGEKLGILLDEYKDVDLIIEALKEAILKPEVKNKYNYAEGILRNWKNELTTNLEQLNAKRAREVTQHGSNGSSYAKATGKDESILGGRTGWIGRNEV